MIQHNPYEGSPDENYPTNSFPEVSQKKKLSRVKFYGIAGVIVVLLSAIALPSFSNQAYKAKQSNAKMAMGQVIRAQQAYYLENSRFAGSLSQFQTRASDSDTLITGENTDYIHAIYTLGPNAVEHVAIPKNSKLRTYVAIAAVSSSSSNETTTTAVVCESAESDTPLKIISDASSVSSGSVFCPQGFKSLGQ